VKNGIHHQRAEISFALTDGARHRECMGRSRYDGLVDSALLILPGVIWGASFLFIAEGLAAMGPNGVTFVRIVIGFVTLSLFPAPRRPIARGDGRPTAWLGVLWFAFPLSMFPLAEQHVSSALTGMLNGATPLFVAVVASLLARKLPARAIVIGLLVGFTGTILMGLPGAGSGSGSRTGVLLVLAALMSYGVALNVSRPLQQRNGALPVIWRALGVGLLLTAPLGVMDVIDARWSLRPMLALAALGALGTGIANVLVATAAGRMGATRASATTFLIPVVALLLGVVVRDEVVHVVSVIGVAVCLTGAWLLRQAQSGVSPVPALSARVPDPSRPAECDVG
jgi:drug/metabolite transporter (DMT)-like permease